MKYLYETVQVDKFYDPLDKNVSFRRHSILPGQYEYKYKLVSWSLTSLFSTNMAISETKGQGWRVIFTQ